MVRVKAKMVAAIRSEHAQACETALPCESKLDSAETSVAGQFATVKMMSGTVGMALLAAGAVVALIGLILIALSCKGGGKVSAV